MTPNAEQKAAIAGLTDWIVNATKPWAAKLEGSAGTGKTFTIARIIEAVGAQRRLGLLAPTHKAKKAALDALARAGVDPRRLAYVGTVSAAIGKIPSFGDEPDENGHAAFRRTGQTAQGVTSCDVLIVDEMSMIDHWDAKALRELCDTYDIRVLFTGDFAQLNPVAGKSIRGPADKIRVSYRLDRIMRTGGDGSRIDELANSLRESDDVSWRRWDGGPISIAKISNSWKRRFIDDPEEVAIVYRNIVADNLNDLKRRRLHGTQTPPPFVAGETILVSHRPVPNIDGEGAFAHISDELTVIDVGKPEKVGSSWAAGTVDAHVLTVKNADGSERCINAVLSRDAGPGSPLARVLTECKTIPLQLQGLINRRGGGAVTIAADEFSPAAMQWFAERAMGVTGARGHVFFDHLGRTARQAWADIYYGTVKRFSVVQHRWAMTAHKSQGSTFQRVAVDIPDLNRILNPEDRRAAKYVAISRASESVSILAAS